MQNCPTLWWWGKVPKCQLMVSPHPSYDSIQSRKGRLSRWESLLLLFQAAWFPAMSRRCFFFLMYNQGRHLGRGTRTNIFSAQLLVRGDEDSDDDDEFNNNPTSCKGIPVVLKILDQKHKDIALVCVVIFVLWPMQKERRQFTVSSFFFSSKFLRPFLKRQVSWAKFPTVTWCLCTDCQSKTLKVRAALRSLHWYISQRSLRIQPEWIALPKLFMNIFGWNCQLASYEAFAPTKHSTQSMTDALVFGL